MRRENNATNQYLGHCLGCKKFEALSNIEGLCWNCLQERNKLNKEETK